MHVLIPCPCVWCCSISCWYRWALNSLTHWDRLTHICVSKLRDVYITSLVNYTIIGSDNGLSPLRRQPIIWNNDGLLSIRSRGTYSNEILFEFQEKSIQEYAYENAVCKNWRASCLGLSVSTPTWKSVWKRHWSYEQKYVECVFCAVSLSIWFN